MTRYLDTRGMSSLAIAICDRCKRKHPLVSLNPDRNSPGLRVCDLCNDEYDPWRLPARQPDQITISFPRPDTPLITTSPPDVNTSGLFILNQSTLDGLDVLG